MSFDAREDGEALLIYDGNLYYDSVGKDRNGKVGQCYVKNQPHMVLRVYFVYRPCLLNV